MHSSDKFLPKFSIAQVVMQKVINTRLELFRTFHVISSAAVLPMGKK
jgi:hypothetical protein